MALDGKWIAQGAVLLVDALHFHESVARRRLLQEPRVDLVQPLLQLLASLVRRQIAIVLLGFDEGNERRLERRKRNQKNSLPKQNTARARCLSH